MPHATRESASPVSSRRPLRRVTCMLGVVPLLALFSVLVAACGSNSATNTTTSAAPSAAGTTAATAERPRRRQRRPRPPPPRGRLGQRSSASSRRTSPEAERHRGRCRGLARHVAQDRLSAARWPRSRTILAQAPAAIKGDFQTSVHLPQQVLRRPRSINFDFTKIDPGDGGGLHDQQAPASRAPRRPSRPTSPRLAGWQRRRPRRAAVTARRRTRESPVADYHPKWWLILSRERDFDNPPRSGADKGNRPVPLSTGSAVQHLDQVIPLR